VGSAKTYIQSEVTRVRCEQHGVVTAAVPWARHKSRFCKTFEDTIAWLTVHTSKSAVSEYMRVKWHTIGPICERVYEELAVQQPSRFDELIRIGIDETSYKKCHKYMTVVTNHDTGKVVWCDIGYGKETLSKFFEILTPEQRASIQCVSADGAGWIADCVKKYCPKAERCIDPFHVVSWATKSLAGERRNACSEAQKAAAEVAKKKDPSQMESKLTASKKERAKTIKNTKYTLLKDPDNLSEKQQEQISFLAKTFPVLHRAYLLKENLRLVLKSDPDEIEPLLDKWMSWAQRCRIPSFRELRKKIKRHREAIIAAAKHHLSNARSEGINNKIKHVQHKAYGFRNTNNLLAMVMLSCSDIAPILPGR